MDSGRARVHQSPRLALYTAFFCLAKNTPYTPAKDYIEAFFRFLFDFSFPVTVYVPNSKLFPIEAFYYLRQFWTHGADKGTVERATAYTIAVLVMANLAYVGYLVYFYTDKRSSSKPPPLLTKVMHEHIMLSSGPLVVPYTSIMLIYITCHRRQSNCNVVGIDTAEFAFFCVVIFLHNFLALMYKVSVYDWSPYSKLPAAKVHSRVCIVATPVRSIMTVVFGLLQNSEAPHTNLGLVIVCILYQALLCFSFWYEQPFQRKFINDVHVGIYAVACMASVAVLFSIMADGSGDIACIGIFLVGSILLIPAVLKMNDVRLKFVRDAPLSSLKTPTDVELRVRHEQVKLVQAYMLKESNDVEDMAAMDTTEIERILHYFQNSMRYSFKLNTIWATYLFLFKQNKFVAMQRLRNILEHSPMVFDILPLQIRLRFFAEAASTEEIEAGLSTFEEIQRLKRHALECMSKAVSVQAKFWGTLISEDYTLQGLEALSAQMHYYSEAARQSFIRILQLNPKSPLFRRLYSQYLMNVANDENGAKRQLSRAVELENEEDVSKSMNDSNNSIVIISGEKYNRGEILEVNDQTCQVFQCKCEDMIGKPINTYMARPFAPVHNNYLTRYIEDKRVVATSATKKGIIMKNTSGFIFEGNLLVREYANFTLEPSIAFFGVIRSLPNRIFCILRKNDLVMWDMSQLFFQFFNPDWEKLRRLELTVVEHIPDFAEENDAIACTLETATEHNFETELEKNGSIFRMCVQVTPLLYLEQDFYHVLLENKQKLPENQNHYEDLYGRGRRKSGNSTNSARNSHHRGGESDDYDSDDGQEKVPKEDKNEEAESVNSSRSGNILRMTLNRGNSSLDYSLRYLFYSIVVLCALLSALGISMQIVWSELTLSRYQATMNLLTSPIHVGTITATYNALMYQHIMNKTLFF
jgi:PAS domain S-box-containing protein